MLNKISLIIWFVFRPSCYLHFFSLIQRKFLKNYDSINHQKKAYEWASKNSVTYSDALKKLGLEDYNISLDNRTIKQARDLEAKSSSKMGGSAYIDLLYNCVTMLKANNVIETGVAYGWSSLAILKALSETSKGKLYSIDMPYPGKNNENDVGIVVPENLKKNWILIRKPDKPGIKEALSKISGKVDLCHYDSDKSWWGRHYAYPLLWDSLKSNGLFISDDIQDNLYFSEFVKEKVLNFAVVQYQGKFIGLIRKS